MKTTFVHLPKNRAYYKAVEDCCYEIVSYDKNNLGITNRIERGGLEIFNSSLICCCDDECQPISEEEYYRLRTEIAQYFKMASHISSTILPLNLP